MSMAHRGPSTALRAIVTLRTAVLLAGADMARTLAMKSRVAISSARDHVLRSVTAAPKLSMALDGPSTCPLTSPFPMSSPATVRASRCRQREAGQELGSQAHWSVAGTLARDNGAGRAVLAYRGRIFIAR